MPTALERTEERNPRAIEITPKVREVLETAFRAWHGLYYNELEYGAGTGDVVQLFAELKAAVAKASNSD